MVNFYVIQIRDLKTMTIDDVPKLWRKKVKEKNKLPYFGTMRKIATAQ